MKKRFSELLDKADAEVLGGAVDSMSADRVDGVTVSRIRKRVTGANAGAEKKRSFGKWLPALGAAACAAVIFAVVTGVVNSKKNGPAPAPGPGATTELNGPDGTVIVPQNGTVIVPQKCDDKFAADVSLGAGSFRDVTADRETYCGIRFFEDSGQTFMICNEDYNVFAFDGNMFRNTGVKTAEKQFFTDGAYNGYSYVGGVFHCVGGNESGLFRVELSTGKVEKFIDCSQIVTAVVVDGPKIYYTTYVYKDKPNRKEPVYSLRLADLEKKEIRVLYETDSDYIVGLSAVGDQLFFNKKNAVCRITPDMMLYTIETGSDEPVYEYAVSGDVVYVYNFSDAAETRTRKVIAFDGNGSVLATVSESGKYFIGSSMDTLTVYDGKIVAFDEHGYYLLDVAAGQYEKIVFQAFLLTDSGYDPPSYFWHGVSKTVYNGKLYLNFRDSVIEYSSDGVRSFRLK